MTIKQDGRIKWSVGFGGLHYFDEIAAFGENDVRRLYDALAEFREKIQIPANKRRFVRWNPPNRGPGSHRKLRINRERRMESYIRGCHIAEERSA